MRLLLVEDEEDVREMLTRLLEAEGRVIETARSGEEALDGIDSVRPDLILLDIGLPGIDGLEVSRRLRARVRWRSIPIVFLTADRRPEVRLDGFSSGADDYITKPFSSDEVEARVRAMLRKRLLYLELESSNRELRRTNRRLEGLLVDDEKTGLCNYRHFRERLEDEFRRADRYETPLSLLMMDLDDFKKVNDTHGHPEGDRVLAGVAATLQEHARVTDLLARYGGEEFAAVLPSTSGRMALRVGERFRLAVAAARVGSRGLRVTLSIGAATFAPDASIRSTDELIARADQALYQAKQSGKNRVALDAAGARGRFVRAAEARAH